MKKYKVTIYYQTHIEVEVECSNPDDVRAYAYMEAGKSKYDQQALNHMQAADYSEVEEIEED